MPPTAPNWTLPAAMYRSPEQFALERERIFAPNWSLFTWSRRLANPGDYVTGTLAGYPIFVLRGEDGTLRGFHNACRHRGATLLAADVGTCGKVLTCPYHAWAYARDGRLIKATDFGATLDAAQFGLLEIDVDEWRGFVFARIKRGGGGLRDWLGPIDAMAADYDLESQRFFAAKEREVAVDWKAYGENYLECYHCRMMHPGLCEAMDIGRYTIDVHRRDWSFHLHAPRREGGFSRGLYFYRFPFLMLNLYDWGSSIATLEPVGPGRVRHVNWYFFTDVSAERAEANTEAMEWSARIVTEDLDMLLGVQRNLDAGAYDRGPLSPRWEHAVAAFQDMVRTSLDDRPALMAAE